MNAPFLSEEYVLDLYRRHAPDVFSETLMQLKIGREGGHDGGLSRVDAELVYMLLRDLQPRQVIEFSPNYGYSSGFIAQALKDNANGAVFATFDLGLLPGMADRMNRFNLAATFYEGDALQNVPLYIVDNGLVGNIDFCFIDSDHSYDFARRYCNEIIPLLGPRCILFIHDMCYRPQDFQNFTHYGEILPFEIGGTLTALGEAAYLQEWAIGNTDYVAVYSTHRLFGDNHENSSILPRNENLIKTLTDIDPHFSLPPSAGQDGGMPRCPMGLFVMPRALLHEWDAE